MSVALAKILGHLCGDGQLRLDGIVYWNTNVELINDWERAIFQEFKLKCWRYVHKNVIASGIGNVKIAKCLSRLLKEKNGIKIPRKDLLQRNEEKITFLQAIFDDDGTVYMDKKSQRRQIKLYSKNKNFLKFVKKLLESLKINSKIYGEYKTGFGNLLFELRITKKENILSFYNNIGFLSTAKQFKLKKIVESYKSPGSSVVRAPGC